MSGGAESPSSEQLPEYTSVEQSQLPPTSSASNQQSPPLMQPDASYSTPEQYHRPQGYAPSRQAELVKREKYGSLWDWCMNWGPCGPLVAPVVGLLRMFS